MFHNRKLFIQVANVLKRRMSSKPKVLVELEDEVNTQISNELMKPKKHPGIVNFKVVGLPDTIIDAIKRSLGDTSVKAVLNDSVKLVNYLKCRHIPPEEWEIREKRREIIDNLEKNNVEDTKSTLETDKKMEKMVQKTLQERVYKWAPIQYDKYKSFQYLLSRAAPEYTVICRLFEEINNRIPNYKPENFFDFGSGVGTGVWAAREFWGQSLQEYFTVDISADMNELARLILCDGMEGEDVPIKKYFQRQFLPGTPLKYNVVLCAYSLFELPSAQSRLLTIQNLWRKTTDFLVIIEHGTNAGYKIINEARDFILDVKEGPLVGHVFSPCPHDDSCPRFVEDNTPCNFLAPYNVPKFANNAERKLELFSYVILRKGKREDAEPQWPRIVRPVLVRSQHVICRMCTGEGKLSEVILTAKKNGKIAYRCARASKWGDRLPVKIESQEIVADESINETEDAENDQTELLNDTSDHENKPNNPKS